MKTKFLIRILLITLLLLYIIANKINSNLNVSTNEKENTTIISLFEKYYDEKN